MEADIFCKIIDNYGDIGFCWRLAKHLSCEYKWSIRLIVDDLCAFSCIEKTLDISANSQIVQDINIMKWNVSLENSLTPSDIILETFSCDIPNAFKKIMLLDIRRFIWINIEYLSAEQWVEDCHLLSSNLSNGLKKTFFFPGFTSKTGGLIVEQDFLKNKKSLKESIYNQEDFLKSLGIKHKRSEFLFCLLFCYPDAPVNDLIRSMKLLNKKIVLIANDQSLFINANSTNNLKLVLIPFIDQDSFDKLICCMDINFIRGEDSFVRALLSGNPLIWNIYKQENNTHIDKLKSWLNLNSFPVTIKKVMYSWNNFGEEGLINAIEKAMSKENWNSWKDYSRIISEKQISNKSLGKNLVEFCTSQQKQR
ncbi:conserved hypothetical protein of the DUF2331 family [Candidatus Kinetoplastibacterium blastocrithidii TCC012E]|uniref:Protein-arginine rhamnosyltransferase n=1 Tax=Candidatus Kinetoplastidibacterium blastocrithidiae TCC012E TaxID=1208922 RepID=M1LAW5_9PROT|nr:elongation factor P maturation arginine rhamnosyltransferase EarP [Candidatus Kinetoplastibacterium blastocrithidii]AFZ83516.1 hypothetical protein CKBE_00327 [Candidatus Kinetoplastibacterium blastocrithidii (ex Strigomonas culicis)]AGF49613.1 conserved hypothetical protein of the DUF2331 family [Candidatus Kinetoplastibacterium blastocrithidii TCC012E]